MAGNDVSTVSDQEALQRLRAWLGFPFVDWVLAAPGEALTERQKTVAHLLLDVVQSTLSRTPGLPPTLTLAPLLQFDAQAGTSLVNGLRAQAGGHLPTTPPEIGDDVHDALVRLALDAYGELLLPTDLTGPLITSAYNSPAGTRLARAICADPVFQFFTDPDDKSQSVELLFSTGSGGTLQLYGVGPSLVKAAWEQSQLEASAPEPQLLFRNLSSVLSSVRAALSGENSTVVGVASLTGVVFPREMAIDLGWGRLRAARPTDHPAGVDLQDANRQTTRQLHDGSEVAIKDVGDVILEVRVPYKVFVGEFHDGAVDWPDLSGTVELDRRIIQVRLGYLLASLLADPPVVLPVWRRFIEPLSQSWSVGWMDPREYAGRTPTRLSDVEIGRWRNWIGSLDGLRFERLGVAPTRLLRSSAERRDPYDSLIDAVIAWEALFGARAEATLRVAGSIARILHPPGAERRAARKRLSEIYALRSRVVHGAEVDQRDVSQASREAIRLTIQVLRSLIQDRPELIPMTSGERSTAILME